MILDFILDFDNLHFSFSYLIPNLVMFRFDLFFILVDDCNEVTDYAIARKIIDLHIF